MKTITIHLPDVEAALPAEVQQREKPFSPGVAYFARDKTGVSEKVKSQAILLQGGVEPRSISVYLTLQ